MVTFLEERFGGIGIDDGGNINMPGTFVTSVANQI